MAISLEMLILFTVLFIGIVTLSCLGIFAIVEETERRWKITGGILIVLSYAVFMAISYCMASGWLV